MSSLNPLNGTLGSRKAAHLLHRATFGPLRQDIDLFAGKTVDEAMAILFLPLPHPEPPVDPATGEGWVNPKPGTGNSEENDLITYFLGWHLEQMRNAGTNAREKLTFWLHSHLPVSRSKVPFSTALYYQNKLYRQYAFGSFKELFRKLVYDNAMMVYIDNYLNTAENPNENFAREMFELYTIGKGPQIAPGDYTYFTEHDIKEAARVLTGYIYDATFENYDPDFFPDIKIASGKVFTWGEDDLAILHDPGQKVFSDKFQNNIIEPNEIVLGYATESAVYNELDQLIDMIFDQDATAKFICRKLYRFFVYYKIDDEIEQDIIVPLAAILKNNDYNLQPVLETLFKSEHFYDAGNIQTTDDHIGALIKSPADYFVHLFRFFNIEMPADPYKLYHESYRNILLNYLFVMGMGFYLPPDVAGFPAYFQAPGYNRNWITPTNLAFRYWIVYALIQGVKNEGNELLFQLDILAWVETAGNISNPSDPELLVQELTQNLLANDLPQERFDYFLNTIFLESFPAHYWTTEWTNYINTGEDGVVRLQLSKLLVALMQSPEFQLF